MNIKLYRILRQTYLDACLGRTWDDCRIPSDRLNNASWFEIGARYIGIRQSQV